MLDYLIFLQFEYSKFNNEYYFIIYYTYILVLASRRHFKILFLNFINWIINYSNFR